MLEVPDGFISQLWSQERVELGQNCNQPEEQQTEQVPNMVMITLQMGHLEVNQGARKPTKPREHAHHNERHGEASACHGCGAATKL